ASRTTPNAVAATWTYDEPRFGYDNNGRLTSSTDASGTATFDWDFRGNLVHGGRTVDGAGPYEFDKTYDDGGPLLATRAPAGSTPAPPPTPIRYDEAGRIYSIPGLIDGATYDSADTLTWYHTASGAEASYDTANPLGQINGYTFEGGPVTGSTAMLGEYDL